MAKRKMFNDIPIVKESNYSDNKQNNYTAPVINNTDVVSEPNYETEEPVVETVDGIVEGVDTALNIRRKPEVKPNNQIGIVGKGSKIIVVDPKNPVKKNGEDWYKVMLNGEPGYAMKKYIIIK